MNFSKLAIITISVLVPSVVALLFFLTTNESNIGPWVYQLPKLNVLLNSSTIVLLIAAFLAIKNGRETIHRNLMLTALVLGSVFLVSYITYHANVPSTVYGDIDHDHLLSSDESLELGNWRTLYLVLLLSHILFAVAGLPLVLLAVYYGLMGNRKAHKKIVKFTFPVWLYIAISGVLVYLLISPYY